jgi:hypothetical protein
LLQEPSVQEIMDKALQRVHAPNAAMARLLDIVKRKEETDRQRR